MPKRVGCFCISDPLSSLSTTPNLCHVQTLSERLCLRLIKMINDVGRRTVFSRILLVAHTMTDNSLFYKYILKLVSYPVFNAFNVCSVDSRLYIEM